MGACPAQNSVDITRFVRLLAAMAQPETKFTSPASLALDAVLVVVTVWTFLAAWNEYFLPLVFLRRVEAQVVSMAPKQFKAAAGHEAVQSAN